MALLETERVDDIDAVEADTGRCPVIQLSDWRSLRLGTPSAAATATKRAIDIVVAFVGLVLALPALPFVALAIKLDSPGPVFCRLSRVGLNGEAFWLWKVRTMTADAHTGPVWTTRASPAWDGSCAARTSTRSPSSTTCCAAR